MVEPIPDEVLGSYSEWGDGPVTDMITGGVCRDADALHHLLILIRLTARDLARELLALRAAARVVVSGDAWSGTDGASLGVQADRLFAARAALRALLPEEPK